MDPSAFQKFKQAHKAYPEMLCKRWRLLYKTYRRLRLMPFSRLSENPLACSLGFGILMRHGVEGMVISNALLHRINPAGKTMAQLMDAMGGKIPHRTLLDKARKMTNGIAHPYVTEDRLPSFSQMNAFYQASFKAVLDAHLLDLKKIKRGALRKSAKRASRYLSVIKRQLEHFSFCHSLTATLLRGCLVRQLTECAANFWCWQWGILPTDASTEENPLELSGVLTALAESAKGSRFHGRIAHLFELKNLSNALMHADPFDLKIVLRRGKALAKSHRLIKEACCPRVLKKRLKNILM